MMGRYIKYLTKQYTLHTETLQIQQTVKRWLVLGWVTSYEDQPHLQFFMKYITCVNNRIIIVLSYDSIDRPTLQQ